MSLNAHIRSFSHALQFLTRLPAPPIGVFDPADLSRSALWFPVVGAIVGAVVAAALWTGALASPWIGALLALAAWVWVTGGLHLDGLGDVADALGAAHRSPGRFLEVLRDPHVGAFGVMAIALQLIAKVVLLHEIAGPPALAALVLIPAWARWGATVWSAAVPPLATGTGERFAWHIDNRGIVGRRRCSRAPQRLAGAGAAGRPGDRSGHRRLLEVPAGRRDRGLPWRRHRGDRDDVAASHRRANGIASGPEPSRRARAAKHGIL